MIKFLFCFLVGMNSYGVYHSQIAQDKTVNDRYFKNKQCGVFVDIGAHNGIKFSNTYFFERELLWTGLCVEPIPEVFAELEENRTCTCIKGCVSDFTGKAEFLRVRSPAVEVEMLSGLLCKYDPRHLERVKRKVKETGGSFDIFETDCYLINDLFEKCGFTHIDFLSLDTEGGEFDILATIDFSKYEIDVITVEDNYKDPRFIPFLESKGFRFVERKMIDILFVREAFLSAG